MTLGKALFWGFSLSAIVILFIQLDNDNKIASQEPICRNDWHKCTSNTDLANNYNGMSLARFDCEYDAKNLAKYGDPKFPTSSFGTFLTGNSFLSTKRITLIEQDAQFQNGFGAMMHVEITCIYDLEAKKVVDVKLSQR
jgi:hypothetical protein